jgi:prophage maintenance system killer protein
MREFSMATTRKLLSEIDRKRASIGDEPSYFMKTRKLTRKGLIRRAFIHSWLLEHPGARDEHFQGPITRNSEAVRTGVERLSDAWNYLISQEDPLDVDVLKETASFVEPELNKLGFRNSRARLPGFEHIPPNYVKIPDMVDELFRQLKSRSYHPVDIAAQAHLGLVYIQPFADGNKRTSRMIQDKILSDSSLPGAEILLGERDVYLDLLDQAFIGLRDGNAKMQRPFFDYIAGKVNMKLDEVLNDIK